MHPSPHSSAFRSRSVRFSVWLAGLCLATAASVHAHPGHGGAAGWSSGFQHPLGGLDHVLAMVAVGLWAAQLGRRALWVLPVAFPAAMFLGAALGMSGAPVPGVEPAIALSAVVIGLAVFAVLRPPLWAAGAVVAGFAVFHGYAHGAELPAGAGVVGYLAGFGVATALLHAVGLALGLAGRMPAGRLALRSAGLAVALCGAVFLWQAIGA